MNVGQIRISATFSATVSAVQQERETDSGPFLSRHDALSSRRQRAFSRKHASAVTTISRFPQAFTLSKLDR